MEHLEFFKTLRKGEARASLYFFYGEEIYLMERATEMLAETLGLSRRTFYGDEHKPEEILREAQTLDLFSTRSLIVVRRAHQMPGLQALLSAPWTPDHPLVLIAETKTWKVQVPENALLVRFPYLPRPVMIKWVDKWFRDRGVMLPKNLIAQVVGYLPRDLLSARHELEKVLLFADDERPDLPHFQEVMSTMAAESVYRLADLAVGREKTAAVKELLKLLERRTPPTYITTAIGYALLQVVWERLKVEDRRKGVPEWRRKQIQRLAQRRNAGNALKGLEAVVRTEAYVKSRPTGHEAALLELLEILGKEGS